MPVILLAIPPLALSFLLGLVGPRLTRLVSGRAATVLLTVLALVGALSVGLVLCAVGCLAIAQWAPFAAAGHWSPAVVAARDPLPFWVDVVSGAVALALVAAAAVRCVLLLRRLAWSLTLCRSLGAEHAGSLIILDDDRPEAYALAGLPGRTVVTRAMLRALSGAERRALLAHEASHVACYHFVYVSLVELASSANPLLLPLVPSVRLAVERWADDDAAHTVQDRELVATTLVRAGLARAGVADSGVARSGSGRDAGLVPSGALGAVTSDLRVRVDSLVTPRPDASRTGVAVLAALAVAVGCIASSGALGLHLHNLIEWAQAVGAHSKG